MPLVDANLQSALTTFLDGGLETEAQCAAEWGDMMADYVATMVPPSAAVSAARSALVGGLSGMAVPGAAPALFASAFGAFGAALAGGIPTSTPPGAFALPVAPTADAGVAASAITTAIGIWIRTGNVLGVPWT